MNIGNKLVLYIVLLLAGCSSLPENKRNFTPNPTRYVFKCSNDTLRNVIISELDKLKYRDMVLHYEGSNLSPLDSLEIFTRPENKNDFYLSPSFIWIDESYLYSGFKYVASFHLHLVQIDESHTEVIVYTIKPMVILGKEFWPSFPHFARGYRYHDVSPSTVEEYEILYRIGKSLNEDMPEVNYPVE